MNRFWQECDPAFYANTRSEIETNYPTLHFRSRHRIVILSGSFPVCDEQGVIDYFIIEIELPKNFPRQLPIVREIGERIPRIADRHMFTNGVACLFVQEDWWLSHPNGYSLLEFLGGPVRNFFVGQSMVELRLGWPLGERAHGIRGILECYAELTGAPNLEIAEGYLQLLARDKFNGRLACPCGSGKMIRHCHLPMLLNLHFKIPWTVSRRSWQRIVYARRSARN